MTAQLEHNKQRLAAKIEAAAQQSGRTVQELCTVAITKYVEAPTAIALARLGQRDLGENRAGELEAKANAFHAESVPVRWHFVGHLQRNKARRVAKHADVIHSIDTISLIETLQRITAELGRELAVFLEVRLTDEDSKHGFSPAELGQGVTALRGAPNLRALGLMGMSPAAGSSEESVAAFTHLRGLADELQNDPASANVFEGGRVLTSMGMSGDFAEAISAGADYLRIGSSFFEGIDRPQREVPA